MIIRQNKINFILAAILLPFCISADWLIRKHYYFRQEYWGVFDNWVHGVIAIIICIPLLPKFNIANCIKVYLIASLLDLDHFVINSSFSLSQAIAITVRPPSHSITFAITLSVLWYIITQNKKWTFILFIAIASHVVRDAFGGGTLIFYPSTITQIPYWSYLAAEYSFLVLGIMVGGKLSSQKYF